MFKYVLKRLVLLIPILLGVTLLVYIGMDLAQGSYVDTLITEEMTDEMIADMREAYGENDPVLLKYVRYIWKLLHGDLGTSYTTNQPVFKLFTERIPVTAMLALSSTLVCYIIALPLGIAAAKHPGTLIDNACNVLGVIGLATPNFWLGMMLIVLFGVQLKWLPTMGDETWLHYILPAFTIGTGQTAGLMRITRSSLLEALHMDYLRTARAKGVSEKKVVNKHALKNAAIPILNVALGILAGNFAGAVLTEQVFAMSGVGRVIVESTNQRDIPLACGFLVMKCMIITVLGTITDLVYVAVDPRVKTMYVTEKKKKVKKEVAGHAETQAA